MVSGDVLTRYLALSAVNGGLGYPTGDTTCGLVDGGCAQHFAGGSLYWSAGTGARFVSLSARTRYLALGAQAGALGYPTMDTACNLRAGGCAQTFEHASLYAASRTATAFVVSGDVLTRYVGLRGQNGGLAYPTMDTACGLTGGGCAQNFQGGTLYWTAGTDARVSLFSVRTRYLAARGQNGALGYPTSDTVCTLLGGGCVQHFQNGSIFAGSRTAPGRIVSGPILTHWLALRHVNSRYGYPIGEAYAVPGGVAQRFQGGTLTYVGGRVR